MTQHRATKVLKSHVVSHVDAGTRFRPRRVIVITAGSMIKLMEVLNEYMERNPLTGTIYSTGFDPKENEYYALVRNTFDEPAAEKPFECPLNTDRLTPGQHDVYFKAYPDLKWYVDYIDGDYAYLGLYNVSERTQFSNGGIAYSGSVIATKCTMFLNNTIPNVADYLESVTVNGVTNKVFIPSCKMFSGSAGYDSADANDPTFTWPLASMPNRAACVSDWSTIGNYFWLSSPSNSSYVWIVDGDGDFYGYGYPTYSYGFRPEVKVRFKKTLYL